MKTAKFLANNTIPDFRSFFLMDIGEAMQWVINFDINFRQDR